MSGRAVGERGRVLARVGSVALLVVGVASVLVGALVPPAPVRAHAAAAEVAR